MLVHSLDMLPNQDKADSNPDSRTEPGTASAKDELFDVARDMMIRSTSARDMGDSESARRYLKAALDIMAEDLPAAPTRTAALPETIKITEMLREGWQEVSQLAEATNWNVNRVHSLLARLRTKGENLQTQAIKRYRIAPTKD